MTIRLNGAQTDLPGPMSVTALLGRLGVDPRVVAVEHNLVVLGRASFDRVEGREGDLVEIVNLVGGGRP